MKQKTRRHYFLALLAFSVASMLLYNAKGGRAFWELWGPPRNLEEETHLLENTCKLVYAETVEPSNKSYTCEQVSWNVLRRDKDGSFSWTTETVSSLLDELNCTVAELSGGTRPDSMSVTITRLQEISHELPTFTVNADNFVINCSSGNETVFNRQYMGLKDKSTDNILLQGRPPKPKAAAFNFSMMSVSILGLDSVSRSQFARHMTRTSRIMEEMGFITLNGYNKVGDNSAVNLLPILADRMKAAKAHPLLDKEGQPNKNSILANDYVLNPNEIPFFWQKRPGSVSLFNDDIMHLSRGLFHYPADTWERGFNQSIATHFYRGFYLSLYKELKNKWQLCHDGRLLPEEYLDTWKRFIEAYSHKRAFSFNFIASVTHDNPSDLEFMDDMIAERLEIMKNFGVLENTLLILMGDHGNRIWPTRSLLGGKIEERQPFMSLYLPVGFRHQFPEAYVTLRNNANRMTNNFDIHETILDIVEGGLGGRYGERGTSLFTPISDERSCLENNVPIEFCLCMEKAEEDFSFLKSELTMTLSLHLENNTCLQHSTLRCNSEIESYLPNQLVLSGMRSRSGNWRAEINKKQRAPDSIYLYTTCLILSSLDEPVKLKVQFRYLRESKKTSIILEPMVVAKKHCPHKKYIFSYCQCINYDKIMAP